MIEWLEQHMVACVFVKYLNFECPGCGIQRAFISLMKGEIWESIKVYPAMLPYMLTLLGLVFQIIFKAKNGGTFVMYGFIFSVLVMILSYIYHFIF